MLISLLTLYYSKDLKSKLNKNLNSIEKKKFLEKTDISG
jgi:hypothetical protein